MHLQRCEQLRRRRPSPLPRAAVAVDGRTAVLYMYMDHATGITGRSDVAVIEVLSLRMMCINRLVPIGEIDHLTTVAYGARQAEARRSSSTHMRH